jgi:hypothetical protein
MAFREAQANRPQTSKADRIAAIMQQNPNYTFEQAATAAG